MASHGEWTRLRFNTRATFDTAFPDGTYTFTFGGRSVPVALTGDLYPAAPVATVSAGTWANGTLNVDRTQTLTLTSNFPRHYVAGSSRLNIRVSGPSVNRQADTVPSFDRDQLSLTMPANTLALGQTYDVVLFADRFVSADTTSAAPYVVVAFYRAQVSFRLTAPGGPTITGQPSSQQIVDGSTVVFSVVSPGATSFQWRKNGVAIAGATSATLALFGATTADAGQSSAEGTGQISHPPSLPPVGIAAHTNSRSPPAPPAAARPPSHPAPLTSQTESCCSRN